MTATIDRLASWAVPGKAVRLPEDTAERRILDWFDDLGLVVPEPSPIAMRHTDAGFVEIPLHEADEDEDLIFAPDMPDLDMLAAGCVSMAREHDEHFPGPLSWRRWRLTGWVARALYTSGITSTGGGMGWSGRDPIGSEVYHLPRWSDVLPRRHSTMRPYLLWRPSWWWECHARQGLRLRGRHRPEEPYVVGICAACIPCPSCGAHGPCVERCEL